MASHTPVSFVRGGQVAIHFFRMARQVIKWAALTALVVAIIYWFARATFSTDFYNWYMAYEMARSDTMQALTNNLDASYIYHSPSGQQIVTTVGEFLTNPDFIANYYLMWELSAAWAWQSLIAGSVAALGSVFGFIFIGSGLDVNNRVRGSMLVSVAELQFFIDRKWKRWRKERGKEEADEYNYTLAGVRFPPDAPMVHTMMVGTTGSGKTIAINELLAQIREKGDSAVVYDRMGSFTSHWYDPERDYILNPFDERDAGWSPFADATTGAGFASMAAALIPQAKGNTDPFWNNSAQSVFANIAEKLAAQGDRSISSLRKLVLEGDLATISKFLEGTPAASLIKEKNEKTALSILSAMIPEVEFLKHMKDRDDAFSIRQWVQDDPKEGSFLFLSGHVDYHTATRNLISVAIETAANATMSLEPIDRPRIWFIVDELPTLNYLPFLGSSLAEIRQFGGCFVVGYQVFSQLRDVYGPDMAETISGTVNNRLIFSVGDHATAERCARSLGKEDIEEKNEGMSLGANETRDGVTIQERRVDRDIVTPSQIMDLPTRFAYLRFGYDAPRAKVEFPYVKYELKSPKIVKLGTTAKGEKLPVKRQPKISKEHAGRMAPEEPRHREDMFLAQYREWLKSLVEPDTPFQSNAAADVADLDTPERKSFFLKQRLSGVEMEKVTDLIPDCIPRDPKGKAEYFGRLEYERLCLDAFWKRQEENEAQSEVAESDDPVADEVTEAKAVESVGPAIDEVTETPDEIIPNSDESDATNAQTSQTDDDIETAADEAQGKIAPRYDRQDISRFIG